MNLEPRTLKGRAGGYTLAEVIVGVFVLAIMVVSLYAGFSAGFAIVRLSRENLRATQILVKKMETIRLFNWSQVNNTNVYVQPGFVDWYDPAGTNTSSAGATYRGFVSTNTPAGVPDAYRNKMRSITVTVYWTNYPSGSFT